MVELAADSRSVAHSYRLHLWLRSNPSARMPPAVLEGAGRNTDYESSIESRAGVLPKHTILLFHFG